MARTVEKLIEDFYKLAYLVEKAPLTVVEVPNFVGQFSPIVTSSISNLNKTSIKVFLEKNFITLNILNSGSEQEREQLLQTLNANMDFLLKDVFGTGAGSLKSKGHIEFIQKYNKNIQNQTDDDLAREISFDLMKQQLNTAGVTFNEAPFLPDITPMPTLEQSNQDDIDPNIVTSEVMLSSASTPTPPRRDSNNTSPVAPTDVPSNVMDGLDRKNLTQLITNIPHARSWAEKHESTALAANQTDEDKRAYVLALQHRARVKLDALESPTIQQPTPPSIAPPVSQIPPPPPSGAEQLVPNESVSTTAQLLQREVTSSPVQVSSSATTDGQLSADLQRGQAIALWKDLINSEEFATNWVLKHDAARLKEHLDSDGNQAQYVKDLQDTAREPLRQEGQSQPALASSTATSAPTIQPPPLPRNSTPKLSPDAVSVIDALSIEDNLKITESTDFTKNWVGSNPELQKALEAHLQVSPNTKEDFYRLVQSVAQTQAITKLKQDLSGTNSSALATSPQVAQLGASETARDKIDLLIVAIERLSGDIQQEKDKPTFGDKAIVFDRYALGKNKRLLEKEKQLADMQLVLEQAQALEKDSEKSLQLANFYSVGENADRNNQLLFLKTACSGFHKISKDIDACLERNRGASTLHANATMIEQRRGTSGTGQTRLVTNVDNRAALAAGVMQTMRLHNVARKDQNRAKGLVTETTIEGADPTSVRFRGVALDREKDIIQYTESLTSGSLIYSETSVNKDGCPVVTDRSQITSTYPDADWERDARQAAMIKAENILANYKGKGTIVLRIVQYSGKKEADLARINMEYAAILALSSKSIFSSYPKIVVDIEGFKPPKFSVMGLTANKFIEEHLGKPPHRFTQQANMAQELKALREKDPRVTHGVGINKDGKVVEPEKEKKVERELVNSGEVASALNTSHSDLFDSRKLENQTSDNPLGVIDLEADLSEIDLDANVGERPRRNTV